MQVDLTIHVSELRFKKIHICGRGRSLGVCYILLSGPSGNRVSQLLIY